MKLISASRYPMDWRQNLGPMSEHHDAWDALALRSTSRNDFGRCCQTLCFTLAWCREEHDRDLINTQFSLKLLNADDGDWKSSHDTCTCNECLTTFLKMTDGHPNKVYENCMGEKTTGCVNKCVHEIVKNDT